MVQIDHHAKWHLKSLIRMPRPSSYANNSPRGPANERRTTNEWQAHNDQASHFPSVHVAQRWVL